MKFIRDIFSDSYIHPFYYTAYPADNTRNYSLLAKHHFFIFFKKDLGFTVRKKLLKRISIEGLGGQVFKEKGNMDVELTIDAVSLADNFSDAVLFSGDSDFLSLVIYLKKKGKRVWVVSSKDSLSYELRKVANFYYDLLDIDGIWGKNLIRINSRKK